ARTGDLIFTVPFLVSYLSGILPLLPGDLIFTGTPSGIGFALNPPRYLRDGERLSTYVEGIGTMRNRMTAAKARG
ncbi:fumarylacetoacetate hydrolase family protein, partial [Mycolicibacterium sphagni]